MAMEWISALSMPGHSRSAGTLGSVSYTHLVFTVKATIKFNIAIAITMNQHVGCRKPIGLFFYFNTIDMPVSYTHLGVDAVSGATMTSEAVFTAMNDCLSQAQ